jgi:hypothetical protein
VYFYNLLKVILICIFINNIKCPICLDDISYTSLKLTVCNHVFHEECFTTWLKYNNSCPLCRLDFELEYSYVYTDNFINANNFIEYLEIPLQIVSNSRVVLSVLYLEHELIQEVDNRIVYEAPYFL